MRKMTSEEFKLATEKDPNWCVKLTEPTEITTYTSMSLSLIPHLSPLLHFTGKDKYGNTATFNGCSNLKSLSGTFHGYINIKYCKALEKTDQLKVIKSSIEHGFSATFDSCPITTLEGEYEGAILLSRCNNLKEIKAKVNKATKTSTNKMNRGIKFYIENCPNLKAKKIYLSSQYQLEDKFKIKILEELLLRNSITRFSDI